MKYLSKFALVAAVLIVGMSVTSCRKKREPAPPIEKNAAPAASIVGEGVAPAPVQLQAQEQTQAQPPAPAEPTQEHPAISKSATHYRLNAAAPLEAQMQMLTDALNVYEDWNGGKSPTGLQQLVEQKVIDRLPTPPPGKKFVINAQRHVVELQNQ
jgi:hypothetical protein